MADETAILKRVQPSKGSDPKDAILVLGQGTDGRSDQAMPFAEAGAAIGVEPGQSIFGPDPDAAIASLQQTLCDGAGQTFANRKRAHKTWSKTVQAAVGRAKPKIPVAVCVGAACVTA